MKWRVLISAPYFQPVWEEFRYVFDEHKIEITVPPVNERLSENELLGLVKGIDGVISGDDRFTEAVFAKADRLKVISKWGTGIDSIDLQAAEKYGVVVRNTPNAFTDPVADTTLGYILCFARNLPWLDQEIRNERWEKIKGVALHECTLGVIGVGNIGRAVMRRARGFGMRLIGNDIAVIDDGFISETGMEVVTRDELLAAADFITLNCTLTESSHHLMDRQAFAKMKNSAFLINTARGPLVDSDALAEALAQQQIAGAALDVFEVEPLPLDSSLRNFGNCLFAPHNSNSSPKAWERVHMNTLDNLINELKKSDQ